MARWRSGLTHMPFTHAFTGSNPVRVTRLEQTVIRLRMAFLFYCWKKVLEISIQFDAQIVKLFFLNIVSHFS